MDGYRNPREPELLQLTTAFEEQFEETDIGLLFRRFGRGAPVRISYEEMHRAVGRFERGQRLTFLSCAAFFVAIMVLASLLGEERAAFPSAIGLLAVGICTRQVLWRRAIAQFAGRAAVGFERPLLDQLQRRASTVSWITIVGLSITSALAIGLAAFLLGNEVVVVSDFPELFSTVGLLLGAITLMLFACVKLLKVTRPRE